MLEKDEGQEAGQDVGTGQREALDGQFSMRMDDGHMAVYLSVTLPVGGAPVELADILQEAEKRGITAALDLEAIQKSLLDGGDDVLITSGKAPVAGVDGRFESLVPAMKEKHPHIDEDGLADFRDLGDIVVVQAREALMRRVLPTSGEPGETVMGEAIPVKPGKDIAFSAKLEGVLVDPNDPNLLIAGISGCPVIVKNGVKVEPVYTVANVDLHTGNISFTGSVHVTGDVHAGMAITATGDIHVNGTVENALLEAGGDIVVKSGVIGDAKQQFQTNRASDAAIRCDGSFKARFVQNAHITAGNGIFINDAAIQSELNAGHQIVVGDKGSRKGDIIGGVARAAMLVKANNIGSAADLKTVVMAGVDQHLHQRHEEVVKAREAAQRKLADIFKLLDLERASPGRFPPGTLKTVVATRDVLHAEIETLGEEATALLREIDLARGAQVIALKQVFGGAEISIGSKHYRATREREGGVFRLSEGELVFS